MKRKTLFFCGLLLVFGLSIIANVNATTTQWFPAVGTSIRYKLSNYLTLLDNSRAESTTFTVFNWTDYPTLVPDYMLTNFPALPVGLLSSPIIANHTEIFCVIEYTEKNSTHLWRNVLIQIGALVLTDTHAYLLAWGRDTGAYSMMTEILFSSNFFSVQKSQFFSDIYLGFVDHFDCTLGLNTLILPDTYIVSVSNELIVAFYTDSVYGNRTYIADSSGKVSTYMVTEYDPQMEIIGFKQNSYLFTVTLPEENNGEIPGFSYLWVLSGLLVAVMVIVWKFQRQRAINF